MPGEFSPTKFKELILYIAEKSAADPSFGAIKLNKLLFFADFWSYGNFGRSITGARYQKLDHGPAPRQLVPVRDELLANGEATLVGEGSPPFTRKRLIALRSAELGEFTAEEIALVDELLKHFANAGAGRLSHFSHRVSVGWRLVRFGEDIPYESVLIDGRDPLPSDYARAEELARELEWV